LWNYTEKKCFHPERTRKDTDTVFDKNKHIHHKNFRVFIFFSILINRRTNGFENNIKLVLYRPFRTNDIAQSKPTKQFNTRVNNNIVISYFRWTMTVSWGTSSLCRRRMMILRVVYYYYYSVHETSALYSDVLSRVTYTALLLYTY